VLAVALASLGSTDVASALDALEDRAFALQALLDARAAGPPRRGAELEPDLRFSPELARIRRDLGDHEIRGKLVFGELLGRWSFLQVAAYAIAGVPLSAADAELLGHVGVLTQLADVEIWPLAVVRRVAARGGGLARAAVAGLATMCTPRLSGPPVGGFMRFLDRIDAARAAGRSLEETLEQIAASGERIQGLGRPVLGTDERVPHQVALNARYGRDRGPSVTLALEIDAWFASKKRVRLNSAGMHGALLRDLGFSPAAGAAFSLLYFMVPVLAQAVFSEEQASLGAR
jgi:hypothetical protein